MALRHGDGRPCAAVSETIDAAMCRLDGSDLRELTSRLHHLGGRAKGAFDTYRKLHGQAVDAEAFLELAPKAAARLDALTQDMFGAVLDDIEANLTHAVCEILGQDRQVKARRDTKSNKLSVEFEIENQGNPESVMAGQGGSVCNILSVGLRLIALSQLDETCHRPFLVLDEQDCWLKPELVPKFVKLISSIGKRLGIQILYISHHPVDLFATHAQKLIQIEPNRSNGVVVRVSCDRIAEQQKKG
ncbi:hypothetical protein [Desulfovibrio inopinatus]|uniref:hypothetical protein n=1 Tax=Desulfovibrio inopinatus TaxID=102109 RepID=UPI0004285961|nr:hypothetical protein [Desulfovibrio inopinatus]